MSDVLIPLTNLPLPSTIPSIPVGNASIPQPPPGASNLADNQFRLSRVTPLENNLLSVVLEEFEQHSLSESAAEDGFRLAEAYVHVGKNLLNLSLHETRLGRRFIRLMAEFEAQQTARNDARRATFERASYHAEPTSSAQNKSTSTIVPKQMALLFQKPKWNRIGDVPISGLLTRLALPLADSPRRFNALKHVRVYLTSPPSIAYATSPSGAAPCCYHFSVPFSVPRYASPPAYRERNKRLYRLAHWPMWVAVFSLAPGPLIFRLFAHGGDRLLLYWVACAVVVTGIAGLAGQLPGVETRPYILRFTEDRPNPLYRRICYTTAWGELVAYAALNLAGLLDAVFTGSWHLRQIYHAAYFPLAGAIWLVGALGYLPRVKPSTKNEGGERRWFYGCIWAVVPAQGVLGLLWKLLPHARWADAVKLGAFAAVLAVMLSLGFLGILPRTRPLAPELAGQTL